MMAAGCLVEFLGEIIHTALQTETAFLVIGQVCSCGWQNSVLPVALHRVQLYE